MTSELRELARRYGIQLSHRDGLGRVRRPSVPSLLGVLRALGAPIEGVGDAPGALRSLREELVVEPVSVAWDGKPLRITNHSTRARDCHLRTEDGEESSWQQEARTDIEVGPLPLGYHDLEVGGDTTRIISAPRRAPMPDERAWGVFIPLYALRTERSWGPGDLTDLAALVSWTRGLGGRFVATLPILAAFLDEPFDPSPYAPVSRLFWNELYIDPARAPEFEPSLVSSVEIDSLRRSELVDYRRAYALKRRVLERMAGAISDRRRAELERFTRERPYADEYARFRAKAEGDVAYAFHLYAQFLAEEQLASLDGLYLDLPLGVHRSGFDVERFDVFATNAAAGAPPDVLFAGGQNWGSPPLHPVRSREEGHRYLAESIRTLAARSTVLRIDHVMGLHRLYWVPEGAEATDGAYVRYPADELYAVLTLEAYRHGTTIVGEDLGTVPRGVRTAMRRHGLLRSHIVQFEENLGPIDREVSASLSTHDTPTFARFWDGDLDEGLRRCLGQLASSDAAVVVIALEDLWREERPQNVPGTTEDEHPNWRRPAARTFEEFRDDPDILRMLEVVNA